MFSHHHADGHHLDHTGPMVEVHDTRRKVATAIEARRCLLQRLVHSTSLGGSLHPLPSLGDQPFRTRHLAPRRSLSMVAISALCT